MAGRSKASKATRGAPPSAAVANGTSPHKDVSLDAIAEKLSTMRFRRSIWGADERDVLNKIRRIDEMYRELYRDQETRYQTLLADREREIERLRGGPFRT